MRFYKLRVTTNAPTAASTFNDQFKPETIPEYNDPFRVDWITSAPDNDCLVGDKVRHLVVAVHPFAQLQIAGAVALGSASIGLRASLANVWRKLQHARLPNERPHP